MKNISKAKLKQILKLHYNYLIGKEDGKKADLSYINLYGMDLSGQNLEGIDFTGSDMTYTKLNNSNCANCNFTNSDLTHAMLNNSNLSNSDFTKATILSVNMAYSNINNAQFVDSDLRGSSFECASLEKTKFKGCALTGINVSGATGKKILSFQYPLMNNTYVVTYWKFLRIWTLGYFQGTYDELIELLRMGRTKKNFNKELEIINFVKSIQ